MSSQQYPRISVVIPSFNQAAYLEAAILSVLRQDYPDIELIVLDAGSTDGSRAIIERYEKSIAKWRSYPDAGQASAIAEGLAGASGEILCYLNSDDMYLPGAFRHVAAVFAGGGAKPRWVIGGNVRIDALGSVSRFDRPRWVTQRSMLLWGSGFVQPAAFWNQAMYEAAAPVDPRFEFCMDYDLFLRMAGVARPSTIPAYLAAFRDHGSSKSANLQDVHMRELRELHDLYLPPGSRLTISMRRLLKLKYRFDWKLQRVVTLIGRPPRIPAGWLSPEPKQA